MLQTLQTATMLPPTPPLSPHSHSGRSRPPSVSKARSLIGLSAAIASCLLVCSLLYSAFHNISATRGSPHCSIHKSTAAWSTSPRPASPASSVLPALSSFSSHSVQRVYHQCPVAFGGRARVTLLSHVPVYLFVHQATWRSTAVTPTMELQIGLYSTVTGKTIPANTTEVLSILQEHNISVTYHYSTQLSRDPQTPPVHVHINVSSDCYPSSYRDIHFIHCPLADHPPDSLSLRLHHPPTTTTYTHLVSVCTYVVPHATLGVCSRAVLDPAPGFILQWMRYHLYIGVDIIFLYDQYGRMHNQPAVKQLIAEGRVRYYYVPLPPELVHPVIASIHQIPTYNACVEEMRQFRGGRLTWTPTSTGG